MPVRDHQQRASLQLMGGLRHCPAEGGTLSFAVSHRKRATGVCAGHIGFSDQGSYQQTYHCGYPSVVGLRGIGTSLQGSASLPILRLVAERLVDRSSRDLAPRSLRTRTRRWTLFGHEWDIRRGHRLLCSKGTCKPGSKFRSVNRQCGYLDKQGWTSFDHVAPFQVEWVSNKTDFGMQRHGIPETAAAPTWGPYKWWKGYPTFGGSSRRDLGTGAAWEEVWTGGTCTVSQHPEGRWKLRFISFQVWCDLDRIAVSQDVSQWTASLHCSPGEQIASGRQEEGNCRIERCLRQLPDHEECDRCHSTPWIRVLSRLHRNPTRQGRENVWSHCFAHGWWTWAWTWSFCPARRSVWGWHPWNTGRWEWRGCDSCDAIRRFHLRNNSVRFRVSCILLQLPGGQTTFEWEGESPWILAHQSPLWQGFWKEGKRERQRQNAFLGSRFFGTTHCQFILPNLYAEGSLEEWVSTACRWKLEQFQYKSCSHCCPDLRGHCRRSAWGDRPPHHRGWSGPSSRTSLFWGNDFSKG